MSISKNEIFTINNNASREELKKWGEDAPVGQTISETLTAPEQPTSSVTSWDRASVYRDLARRVLSAQASLEA